MCWRNLIVQRPYLHLLLKKFLRILISLFKDMKRLNSDRSEAGCYMM